ncbi:MAG: HAMP domain-containing histidine kinase, partial [Clostridiales bacterium]|nr:HAMP domain-containing histidine kinase [Clostridiales bacterium]
MHKFFGSIRFRMVAIYLGVVILVFVTVSTLVSALVEDFLVTQRTQDEIRPGHSLAQTRPAILIGLGGPLAIFKRATDWVKEKEASSRLLFLDMDAVVQMDTASKFNGYRLPYREVREVALSGADYAYGFHKLISVNEFSDALTFSATTNWVVYYALPVTAGEARLGVLLYAVSIQDVVDSAAAVTRQIGFVFGIFAVVVGVVSMMLSGWLTKPILTLTNAISHMGAQGYSQRVPVRGKDEISELSAAFNRMSEQLESHDRVRNEFISNASHELKTPLSNMKILAETMLYHDEVNPGTAREFFTDIDHEVDRLTRIINDLLRLVQVENTD